IDYHTSRASFDPLFAYYRHTHGEERWGRALRSLYAARFDGTVARPPHTLLEQRQVIEQLGARNITNEAINKNIRFSHLQNVQVLAPIAHMNNVQTTGLASIGGGTPPRNAPTIRMEPISREQRVQDERAATQLREAAQQRQRTEYQLTT